MKRCRNKENEKCKGISLIQAEEREEYMYERKKKAIIGMLKVKCSKEEIQKYIKWEM